MTKSIDIDTIVVGAGQAGLSVSFYLKAHGVEHLVLEQRRIGESWRRLWDSFTLVTPNRLNALPGFPSGGDPDGFLSRAEVVDYLERFAESFDPPLRLGVSVTRVVPHGDGGFAVETTEGTYTCRHVVLATNIFQTPRPPALAQRFAPEIVQLHSAAYRNPAQLPAGGVLVVGSGQSGAQIADELHRAGRRVHLSVSRAGRLPRRYRGRDMMDWIRIFRGWERTVDELDSPAERLSARPHVTGHGGGRTLDLRQFGRDGMVLTGKLAGVEHDRVALTADLDENLQKADGFARELCGAIDRAIDKSGVEALPLEDEDPPVTWQPRGAISELSLGAAGIGSVIWATGYPFSFDWIDQLEVDAWGYPVHRRGVTPRAGLYFASLPWLHKHKSSSLYGAAEDAEHVALHIASRIRS